MTEHGFEEEVQEDGGVVVVCSCGWRSVPALTMAEYDAAFRELFSHRVGNPAP